MLRDEGHRPKLATRRAQRESKATQPLLGWDYCRLIWVAGSCSAAGYLSEAEAWERIMPAARAIQANYASWREMGQDYLRGRAGWSGRDDPRFLAVYELLCNPSDTNSPWNKIPWTLALGEQEGPESPQ